MSHVTCRGKVVRSIRVLPFARNFWPLMNILECIYSTHSYPNSDHDVSTILDKSNKCVLLNLILHFVAVVMIVGVESILVI